MDKHSYIQIVHPSSPLVRICLCHPLPTGWRSYSSPCPWVPTSPYQAPSIIAVNFAQTQSERHRPSFSSDGLGWAFHSRPASKGDLMTMTTKQLPESPLASRGGVPLFLVSNWESSRSLQPIYLGPSYLRLLSIDIGHFTCIHSLAECRCLEEKRMIFLLAYLPN